MSEGRRVLRAPNYGLRESGDSNHRCTLMHTDGGVGEASPSTSLGIFATLRGSHCKAGEDEKRKAKSETRNSGGGARLQI